MTTKKGQIVELGSVRGIAALMVLLGHTLILYKNPSWLTQFSLVFNGRGAVVIFFILSGYVLTHSLRGREVNAGNLFGFYLKRLFRIYPAIWAASAFGMVYLVLVNFHVHSPEASNFCQLRFRPERFHASFIIASFAGISAYILPPLWSIFVELLGSVLIPLIAYVAFNRTRFFIGAALLALATSFALSDATYYSVALYLFDFYIGAALAIVPDRARAWLASPRLPAVSIAVLAAVLLSLSQFLPASYTSPLAALYEAIFATILIALLIYSNGNFALLRNRWVLYLGDISYSIYLIHFTVACFIMKGLDALGNSGRLPLSTEPKAFIVAAGTLLLTIPLAQLCYHFIELPGIQVGRWVEQQVRARLSENLATNRALSSSS